MKKLVLFAILVVCFVTAFPFWLLVLEHVFRGKDSILTIIMDGIVFEKNNSTKPKRVLTEK